jgi:hypothetical protein
LICIGLVIGLILFCRRKRSAPVEPPDENFPQTSQREILVREPQFSEQMIDPADEQMAEPGRGHEGRGLETPETMIPDTSDFDPVPDIHDIDL